KVRQFSNVAAQVASWPELSTTGLHREQYVTRFEVTVQNSTGVHVIDRFRERSDQLGRTTGYDWLPVLAEPLGQSGPGEVIGSDVRQRFRLACFINQHDVRMVHSSTGLSFPDKSLS